MRRRTLFPVLALALWAPALRADPIIFSNVNSTACICGFEILGSASPGPGSLAEAFTPVGNYVLTGAEARLVNLPGSGSATVDFAVYSNSAGLPGTLLGTLGSVTLSPSAEGVFSASGPISPLDSLNGMEYWLVLTPGTPDTSVGWEADGSSSVPFAGTADTTGTSGWNTALGNSNNSQFEIDGTLQASAIPEPASIWLLLTVAGMTGLKLAKDRRAE